MENEVPWSYMVNQVIEAADMSCVRLERLERFSVSCVGTKRGERLTKVELDTYCRRNSLVRSGAQRHTDYPGQAWRQNLPLLHIESLSACLQTIGKASARMAGIHVDR